jgi:hypothetical protein
MNGKKEIYRYRSYLICIAFLLMIALSGISSAKTNFDRPITISLDKYYEVPMSEVKAGEILNVEMQVTSGSAVDVLLMKPSDYADYQNAIKQKGTVNYIANGSSLGVTTKKYTYTFQEAGDYYLVIDNTDAPKGGGPPMNQVEMNLKVRVEAPQTPSTSGSTPSGSDLTPSSTQPPKTPGFEAIISAFVIVVLFFRLSKNQ